MILLGELETRCVLTLGGGAMEATEQVVKTTCRYFDFLVSTIEVRPPRAGTNSNSCSAESSAVSALFFLLLEAPDCSLRFLGSLLLASAFGHLSPANSDAAA